MIERQRPSIRVEYLSIEKLKPNPKNAKTHPPQQIRQIESSIDEFGFLVPVVIDKNGVLIAGHARYEAAKRAGLLEIPTVCAEHLSEAQKIAFAIADNRLTEKGTWNEKFLADNFQLLANANLTFDMEITGFEVAEIDLLLQEQAESAKEDPADDLSGCVAAGPVSKTGDLWQLGQHRLLCGNSLDESSYEALMDAKLAAIIFTDPPYNVPIVGFVSGAGSVQHREFAMANGDMAPAAYTEFLQASLTLASHHSKPGSIADVCMDWRHLPELFKAGQAAGLTLINIAIWVKNNAGMGSLYRSQHEEVCVFKIGTVSHRNNVQLGRFGRNRTNVWNYPGALTFSRTSDEGNLLALHPTVKPVRLVAEAILDCSRRGDIVLDPFLGSGTTIIAAARTGRRCFGIEIDPLYVDTIVRRWQQYCGGEARLHSDGRLFGEIEAERRCQP